MEFSCQEDRLQPRVLLWFQRKATSMNERFQRAYLRSWVQVKELGVGEADFPFVRRIWALFFSAFCWVQKGSAPLGFRAQFTALRLWRKEGRGCLMYIPFSPARGRPSTEQPHQASSFSAWCLSSAWPTSNLSFFYLLLSSGLCPLSQAGGLRDIHTLYLVYTLLLVPQFCVHKYPRTCSSKNQLAFQLLSAGWACSCPDTMH